MLLYSNSSRFEKHKEDYNKFYTKKGWLTPYALSCGYKEYIDFQEQIRDFKNEITLELFTYKSTCIVRAFNYTSMEEITYNTFESITEARENFCILKRNISSGLIS